MRTLPEVIGPDGILTDGDWVESKDQDPSGSIRLTQLADVGDGEFRDRSDRWINEEQAARLNVTLLEPGDLLIARMPDPLGRACVCPRLPSRAITVVDVCIVRAPAHNPKWLMHAINAPQTRATIASFQAGSTRKRISKANLSTIPIPLPDRSAQDRIVAAIETHFSRLDAAIASLQRAKANVKCARASVLQAAVEGRLVPTEAALARAEGRDYEPASVLLARILAERKAAWAANGARGNYKEAVAPVTEALPELPEGWRWTTVDQCASSISYGTSAKCSDDDRGVAVLRMGNIVDGKLEFSGLKYLPRDHSEVPDGLLEVGELLFNRTNSLELVGKSAVYKGQPSPCACASYLIRVKLSPVAHPEYLNTAINSLHGRLWVKSVVNQQVGQANVNGSKLKAYTFPLPPLPEQHRIVAEVDRRLSVLDALGATFDATLAHCARLRQAILQRAFSGRLVPVDGPPVPA